jgi:hypothetical protein
MNDLATLQQKLNSDPTLRAQFMKEPASYLQTAGLQIVPEQAQKLTANLASLTTKQPMASTPGIIIVQVDGR